MPVPRLVTLLSDFGLSDVYVGVMKGVIAQINPTLTVIDLSHEIPPQNIAAGQFCLMSAYPYFPDGTVHIAVVDPGVGGNRRAVAIEFANAFLVCPDNGLFSGILSHTPVVAAIALTNREYWRTPTPSKTFHGRDIFASVGAHLASGVPFTELGQKIAPETLVPLPISEYSLTDTGILGCIQYVDRFGNLITNIPAHLVDGKNWFVKAAGLSIPGNKTYSNTPDGSAIALLGSHGCVEIAVSKGNAQSQLQIKLGDAVQIVLH
ncbi:SAM-dependent chlorinase/fluorinase [Planktothrix sp. FACHB-1355]|uniref:SAM-dependent chlorinase/fluorinase n=1 Tax=Aerosakkonema funiforme FACHB-1375 TaxID=2949571 RepID=A0A926VKB8_9CYAN|nr:MULTISPECIES: SAM-dependent chlorinase/fluorinase [Oscillatoriales]MBD2185477.1 SAM-dependent chlorinase/fluorinase [Aerosakkonema funiforme FACHB-1375]MBD3560650.1 SAM-dependent chlorinase/fluorinase [Planktothrix sp. FACHB-1355]